MNTASRAPTQKGSADTRSIAGPPILPQEPCKVEADRAQVVRLGEVAVESKIRHLQAKEWKRIWQVYTISGIASILCTMKIAAVT